MAEHEIFQEPEARHLHGMSDAVSPAQSLSSSAQGGSDYTTWQREHFGAMGDQEFLAKMESFEREHPYTGGGSRL